MTYDEITALALSYSDRNDDETKDRIDGFIKVVESRINRALKTMKMSTRASLSTVEDQEYYGLPPDFSGLRDIEIVSDSGRITAKYMSPEQLNNLSPGSDVHYTIIANQLQIKPSQLGKTIEIVYFKTLNNLNSTAISNWVSIDHPDCYIFGILTEINAFVKDPAAMGMWDARFKEVVGEIELDDNQIRWSGTSLQTRVG